MSRILFLCLFLIKFTKNFALVCECDLPEESFEDHSRVYNSMLNMIKKVSHNVAITYCQSDKTCDIDPMPILDTKGFRPMCLKIVEHSTGATFKHCMYMTEDECKAEGVRTICACEGRDKCNRTAKLFSNFNLFIFCAIFSIKLL